jgi:regulator of sirC expression with transglutaminase-like and TPR domain
MNPRTFQEELTQTPINLPRAALQFAREIAYPDLDISDSLEQMDRLAEAAGAAVAQAQLMPDKADALAYYLFQRLGYRGNSADYSDPRNSYLNKVLERRLGIPISLSVLYVAVAERLDIPALGVGMPGHFIVTVLDPQGAFYLDPFHGGSRLSLAECARLVALATGTSEPFRKEWLNPSPPVEILTRMLNNLRQVALQSEDWHLAAAVVEHLRLVQPDAAGLQRDLGVIYHRLGSLRRAVENYEAYLERSPQAPEAESIRANLLAAAQKLARLN